MNTSCIIIDDESRNVKLLEALIREYFPSLTIAAAETNPKKGLQQIEECKPQLIFLDIEMPQLTGFDILKKMEPLLFEVIFVTAYNDYAVEAFDYHAIGYLTKPINTEKFIATVTSALQRIEQKNFNKQLASVLENTSKQDKQQKIPLSTSHGLLFVKLDDIIYCESNGNYTEFYLTGNKHNLVTRQIGEYEKLLPNPEFIRIHDRYIINLSHITEYIKGSGGEVIMENGKTLPVATRRKEEFLSRFDKWLRRKN
ncbi:MAG TPA: LytTR family DNA-binding domain-containing protein [Chitinophagaceae bacterium]|nr:LytTR family DNA-binding domain-containing protein [Chitinophagaceae bacterium]